MAIPSIQVDHPNASDFHVNFQTVKQTLQSGINKDSISIAEFMSQKQLKGGIELDLLPDSGESTISKVLTSQQDMKYQLGDIVDKEGMGAIFTARDINLRRNVAMKILLDPQSASNTRIERFIEEAQITGQLEHPSIVPLHDLAVDEHGNLFYTMKLIKGATLQEILQKIVDGNEQTIKKYPLSHFLTIFQKICNAIAFAHSKRVIHRDVNPENIMLGDYGEVMIMDWGLARVLPKKERKNLVIIPKEPANADEVPALIDGAIVGSLGYIAPEQVRGKTEELDERTDIFALGAILYNILTLNPPILGDDLGDLIRNTAMVNIPSPSVYNNVTKKDLPESTQSKHVALRHLPSEKIPDSLAAVAMKALSADPWKRYQNVQELQKDIAAYQNGFATRAEQAGFRRQVKLFVRRQKTVAILTLSILFLSLVTGIVSTVLMVRSKKAMYLAQKEEQTAKVAVSTLNDSIPDLVELSQAFIEKKQITEALRRISSAVELMPDNPEYRSLKGNALQTLLRLKEAEDEYDTALKIDPTFTPARENKLLCQKLLEMNKGFNVFYNATVGELYAGLRLQKRFDEAIAVAQQLIIMGGGNEVEKIIRKTLDDSGFKYTSMQVDTQNICKVSLAATSSSDLSLLQGMPINHMNLRLSKVNNLSLLRGLPLTYLDISYTAISDLSPLKDMELTLLRTDHNEVTDLTPLKNSPLKALFLCGSRIRDISALKGMPLEELDIRDTGFRDFHFLKDLPLKKLYINGINDLSVLKGLKVTSLILYGSKCSNLAPLKSLPLTNLVLTSTSVRDLSPLKGMSINELDISNTAITDLSPLTELPLTTLYMDNNQIALLPQIKAIQSLTSLRGIECIALLKQCEQAIRINNFPLARTEANKIIEEYRNVPALAYACKPAQWYLEFLIPFLEKNGEFPAGTTSAFGHHYCMAPVPMKWSDADAFAQRLGGHLATVTSIEKWSWLQETFQNLDYTYLGGFKDVVTGKWKWVTGEKWDFAAWAPNQPDNSSGRESVINIYLNGFNDADKTSAYKFIIEWNR
ncbi:MAG: hypothetical protein A2283_03035 [Lentisphaerae bacterium RIFOXYA12_FULL_48_11]|nr:MAG: hypothetical protein A2283_03035 [Lentisphaerae bacterium RIFOXYA12_FULL_48_11]